MSRRFKCFPLLFLFVCAFVSVQAQTAGTTGRTGSSAASTKPAAPAIGQTATDEHLQTGTLDNGSGEHQSHPDNPMNRPIRKILLRKEQAEHRAERAYRRIPAPRQILQQNLHLVKILPIRRCKTTKCRNKTLP